MTPDKVFPFFLGAWVILGLASFWFYRQASFATKKRWHPILAVSVGLLFLGIVWAMSPVGEVLYFAIPAVALITWLNVRLMKFCSNCGATLYAGTIFFAPLQYCQKCGAKLPD